jgi:DNA invertase Pin-like site-specific DNA recombinase
MMTPSKPSQMIAYVRVSSVGTRDVDSASYQTEAIQLEECERWGRERDVAIVSDSKFVDRDVSGAKDQRAGFTAAMEEVRAGGADGIVVATLDRFSRQSTIDALKRVEEVQDAGGEVASAGGEVPVDPTTPAGEFQLTIFAGLARMQWREYDRRWRTAKRRALERGAKISRAPLGYVRNGDGSLKPNPETAPIVKRAFDLAASDGPRAAKDYLNEVDVVNPAKHPKTGEYGETRTWTTATVRRLLSNRAYLGEARYGDYAPHEGAHLPLVDLATWTQAQSEPAAQRSPSGDFTLSGIARCATCGNALSGTRMGKSQKGYRCAHNQTRAVKRGGVEPCPAPTTVLCAPLEEYVQAALLQHAATERPDELVTLQEGRGDSSDVEAAESALRSAVLQRDEDAVNLDLPRDVLRKRMDAHERAIEEAQERYEQVLADARPPLQWPLVDEVALATVDQLPALLERCGLGVRVAPGRGQLQRRVTLEPIEGAPGA